MAGGGYGGYMVALNTLLPSEQSQLVSAADTARSQARVAKATVPYAIAGAKADLELKTLATANATEFDNLRKDLTKESLPPETAETPAATTEPTQVEQVEQVAQPQPSPLAKTPLFAPEVEAEIVKANPNDPLARANWDQKMAVLSKTVPQAKQFIGKFGDIGNLKDTVAKHEISQVPQQVEQKQSELATQKAATPQSFPTAPAANNPNKRQIVSPETGKPSETLTRMMILDPVRTSQILKMQALDTFQRNGDLNVLRGYAPDVYQTAVTAATQLGEEDRKAFDYKMTTVGTVANGVIETGQRDGPKSSTTLAAYDRSIDIMVERKYLTPEQGAAKKAEAKAHGIPWGELAQGKANAFSVVKAAEMITERMKAEATAQNGGSFSYVGTNPDTGTALVVDQNTGQIVDSGTAIGAKPGAGAATFEAKKSAWLQLYPNDQAGALQYANGQKAMSQQDAMKIARSQANAEADSTAKATGTVWTPAQIDQRAQQIASGYVQAAPSPAGPAAAAAPVQVDPKAHAAFKGHDAAQLGNYGPNGWTLAQSLIAQHYGQPTAQQVGLKDHPFIIKTPDQRKAWVPKSGDKSWWVGPDGKLRQGWK